MGSVNLRRSGGRKTKLIQQALREKLGITADVWYEPINGPCIEMQGYAGGWYYSGVDEAGDHYEDVLGYNVAEALTMIQLTADLRKHDDAMDAR